MSTVVDTVLDALAAANRLDDGESFTIPEGQLKRVRVPGKQIGACKIAGADVEPTILIEVGDEIFERHLAHEVEFHGPTWMGQSVGDPCPANGAILWLETSAAITISGRRY